MILELALTAVLSSSPPIEAPKPRTFCTLWKTGDKLQKLDFFISKYDVVKRDLKRQNPDVSEDFLEEFGACYTSNSPQLVDAVDLICEREDEDKLSEDDTVFSTIAAYINGCIRWVTMHPKEEKKS